MKSIKERATEAQKEVIEVVKSHFVDIGAEPYVEDGHIKARVVWLDKAPPAEPLSAVSEEKHD